MSSNKKAKEELIKRYGAICFIERLKVRPIKETRRYTSKGQRKRMKQLTFHHILERANGGKATVENGALLSNENHIWFHKQSRVNQSIINQMFQDLKKQYDECKVVYVDDIKVPFEIRFTDFKVEDKKKEKYNRAKTRQELIKLSEKYVDR